MTPVDLNIPNTVSGSTKRIYDRILNSHTALSTKQKKEKQKGTPVSQNYGSKVSVDRNETPDVAAMYNQGIYKKSFPHQSIDDIKAQNNKMKLIKKNKTIEDMILTKTPTIHLKGQYTGKISNSKLYQKYWNTILESNGSKRSINSNSKSRSSAKGAKEFGRLITKSKLRLSGNISKQDPTPKFNMKSNELKIWKLEDANLLLMRENKKLIKENIELKEKLTNYINYDIELMLNQFPNLAESLETMELLFSESAQSLIQERETCKKIYEEYMILIREKEKETINAEINQNYLETKNSLLKEVLTKRNKDMGEVEKGNKQLMAILEKYDTKMDKMREQIEVQRLKIEKYEEMTTGNIK